MTERVCAEASALARSVSGRLILLHSVPPPIVNSDYPSSIQNLAEISTAMERSARRKLTALQAQLSRGPFTVESALYYGAPVPHILAHADSTGADYIFMGSHGHNALYDLLIGSAAQGVLRKSTCPVVIVPPDLKRVRKVGSWHRIRRKTGKNRRNAGRRGTKASRGGQ